MSRIAFVAALEREVTPLIRTWKVRTLEHGGRRYRVFENGDAVLVCGGIGAEAARRATEAVIHEFAPVRVISVGFAGALDKALKVGDVVEPGIVINAKDGSRTQSGQGQGTLVTIANVASPEEKVKLRQAYQASLVDMEAAAVAIAAQARGVEFGALKAISDDASFEMPATKRFITNDGQFQEVRFAMYVIVRPWLWKAAIALARNSAKASRALCAAILGYMDRATLSAELNQNKVGSEFTSRPVETR
jgi:adenosylhomocysteine nucleosidase